MLGGYLVGSNQNRHNDPLKQGSTCPNGNQTIHIGMTGKQGFKPF